MKALLIKTFRQITFPKVPLETQFLGAMTIIIGGGLIYQLSLGYFHQSLPAEKISTVKRQNLARTMQSTETKRHQILNEFGKRITIPVK